MSAAAPLTGILRYSPWDALLILCAILYGIVLALLPSIGLIGLGMWWMANTVSHNFIHHPFFRSRAANRMFSAFLSLLIGIPQSLWQQKHLAHHAERPFRLRLTRQLLAESGLLAILWAVLGAASPGFALAVYLPGWVLGLVLCFLQGHFEHAFGTTSHYSRIYNFLFFNDGYHVEHHSRPAVHWKNLPLSRDARARRSAWPAVLRWLDFPSVRKALASGVPLTLEVLEKLVLHSSALQHFVLRSHEKAFEELLRRIPEPKKIVVIGGGLFPRTALLLQRLAPQAKIVVLDCNERNIRQAQPFLQQPVVFQIGFFDAGVALPETDLLVVPLAFRGNRRRLYENPPARNVIIHDWIWRQAERNAVVSWWLFKRLNLVSP